MNVVSGSKPVCLILFSLLLFAGALLADYSSLKMDNIIFPNAPVSPGGSITLSATLASGSNETLSAGELALVLVDAKHGDIVIEKRQALQSLANGAQLPVKLSLEIPAGTGAGDYSEQVYFIGAGEALGGDLYSSYLPLFQGSVKVGGTGARDSYIGPVAANGAALGPNSWVQPGQQLNVSVPFSSSGKGTVTQTVYYGSRHTQDEAERLLATGSIPADSPLGQKVAAAKAAASSFAFDSGKKPAAFSLNLPAGNYVLKYELLDADGKKVAEIHRRISVGMAPGITALNLYTNSPPAASIVAGIADPSLSVVIFMNGTSQPATRSAKGDGATYSGNFDFSTAFTFDAIAYKDGKPVDVKAFEFAKPGKSEEKKSERVLSVELSQDGNVLNYAVRIRDGNGDDASGTIYMIIGKGGKLVTSTEPINITAGTFHGGYMISESGAYDVSAYEVATAASATSLINATYRNASATGSGAGAGAQNPTGIGSFTLIILTVLVVLLIVVAALIWKRRRKKRG